MESVLVNSFLRLRAEVAWIFRLKARLNKCGAKTVDNDILSQFEKDSYSVVRIFRGNCEQYEPHVLFDGKVYSRQGQVVEVGKLLNTGLQNNPISKLTGIDSQTISRIRSAINEYRGVSFMCKCGKVGGHKLRCDQ